MNIPASVIWFAIFIALFIVYGLHLGHIHAIGFEAYIGEMMRKFDLERIEARREATKSLYFAALVTFVCAIGALVSAAISILNLLNGQ